MKLNKFNSDHRVEEPLTFNRILTRDLFDAESTTEDLGTAHKRLKDNNRHSTHSLEVQEREENILIRKIDDFQFELGQIQTALIQDTFSSRDELTSIGMIFLCELINRLNGDRGYDFDGALVGVEKFIAITPGTSYILLDGIGNQDREILAEGVLALPPTVELVFDEEEMMVGAKVGFKFDNLDQPVFCDWTTSTVLDINAWRNQRAV